MLLLDTMIDNTKYFMWGYGRYTLGINLTDAQLEHPLIKELEDVAGRKHENTYK